MTPKKKAKELVLKYQFYVTTWDCYNDEPLELKYRMPHMKECALIPVNEMIEYLTTSTDVMTSLDAVKYWQEVKLEIEKL
jgi:hypothetical protein